MTDLTIETARIFEPLLKPSRYKGAWGGRGSGKSHYMAGAVVEYCLLGSPHRLHQRGAKAPVGQAAVREIAE